MKISATLFKIYRKILWPLPKATAHRLLYHKVTGKKLNLQSPHDLNEELQYLIVYRYGEYEGKLADKSYVKQYVKNLHIPNLHIPKTLATYYDAKNIDLNKLPNKFVLKCNHGSGHVIICQDKKTFNLHEAQTILNKDLKTKYSKGTLEYHYDFITPLIIAEEYLDDGEHKNPHDYKFYCFNGKAESILVCSERDKNLRLNDYDLNWKELDYTYQKYRAKQPIPRPRHLKEMTAIAEQLSANMPFVRVDLYEINNKIYFGEYTFTPAAGLIYYYKPAALKRLGDKLSLDFSTKK